MKRIEIDSNAAQILGVEGGTVVAAPLTGRAIAQTWSSPLVIAGACEVFDFSKGYDANRKLTAPYGIGRYDEDRRGMYETELFKSEEVPRTIHMGIDIGAAEGTPVFAPFDSVVAGSEFLAADGDYGGTVILESTGEGDVVFSLLGHLSRISQARWRQGDRVGRGDLIGWLGSKKENGGWNPHLHWQLSLLRPLRVDLPGAVRPAQRELARTIFPDPTEILKISVGGWS